jgi:hypothetical protein
MSLSSSSTVITSLLFFSLLRCLFLLLIILLLLTQLLTSPPFSSFSFRLPHLFSFLHFSSHHISSPLTSHLLSNTIQSTFSFSAYDHLYLATHHSFPLLLLLKINKSAFVNICFDWFAKSKKLRKKKKEKVDFRRKSS